MKVSLIIAVYKDTRALELILESLSNQIYTNFEVVVAEDGACDSMKKCITEAQQKYNFTIKHTTQEDKGVRKARSQNNGILASSGEYLIFIDGDCLLYSTFIYGHVQLARPKQALSGRRINLDKKISDAIREGTVKSKDIENSLLTKYLYLAFNKEVRFEQGIYIKPNSLIFQLLQKRKRNTEILGCNFSLWKEDIVRLNGFDELSYGISAIPDDMDWTWRLPMAGIKIESCKNVANMMHLWHKIYDRGDAKKALLIMHQNRKEKKIICEYGLNTHVV